MKRLPPTYLVKNRLRLIGLFIIILCTSIGLALVYFQIYHADTFRKHSRRNFLRYEKITSPRGAILDRHGRLLATNRPVARLVWRGTGKKKLSNDQLELLRSIERVLNISLLGDNDLLEAEGRCKEYTLIEDLSFERLGIIMEQFPACANLAVVTTATRYYPHGTVASHILGYFRDTEHHRAGTLGLEKLFEEQLRGQPGARENMVNSCGKLLISREVEAAQAGRPLQTTIDFDLQLIVERLMDEEQDGAIIVMDPLCGDILAMISRPTFDPNMFIGPISIDTWEQCKRKRPFINRALSSYPPASLFKLVTMAAGLEENVVFEQGTCWNCTGSIEYGGRIYHCNRRAGHGTLDPYTALAVSCNIPCYEIGKRLSVDILARYAQQLGLGSPTGILFAEGRGLIPTAAWKRKKFRQSWWKGETMQVAIGQSYTLVTPLQIARMTGAICTGSLVRPRILLEESIDKQPVTLSPRTRKFLMKSMSQMIKRGTGYALSSLTDFELYAKTGTAQTTILNRETQGKKFLPHGWFAGYGSYKNNQPIVLVILIENTGSSRVATALAKKFFTEYKKQAEKKAQKPPIENHTIRSSQTTFLSSGGKEKTLKEIDAVLTNIGQKIPD
ncbi:MAG: hypothetical protein JW725_02490 [Candidatus Babeliaceae bacterium]|nr:hypothetical protein [Candidatus Babeliaceae bacterium]